MPNWHLARALFNAEYLWQTHDVLEPLWLAALPKGRVRHWLQAIIQLSNACLKLRMQQPKATLRLLGDVRTQLEQAGRAAMAGIDPMILLADVEAFVRRLETDGVRTLDNRPRLR